MSSVVLKEALVEAGVPEARAEEAVRGILFAGDQPTKADFLKLESQLISDMSTLDNKAIKMESGVRSDLAKLDNKIVRLEAALSFGLADLKTKTLWGQIVIAGVIIAAVGVITKL